MKGTLERILEIYMLEDKTRFDKFQKIHFLHPGKSARVLIDNEEVGFIGELHPEIMERLRISERINLFEINLDRIERVSRDIRKKFKTFIRYPAVTRDIALVLDEDVDVGEIVEEIRKVESNLIDNITVFDVFKGGTVEKGKKSVAFSINLRAPDKTLTDEEVNQFQAMALDRVRLVFGAELRKI
jgi:phenylalanyl-tRNA synthetase beta chain